MDEAGGFHEQRPYGSSGRRLRAARPKAEVLKGSSTDFAELARPVTWWVGNCRPNVTEEKVKEVLEQLAATKCGAPDFTVESVHSLTKDPNPYSRSFKVCVPAHLEELMRDPRMYPMSWQYRAFTRWPTRQQAPRAPQVQGGPGHQVVVDSEALMTEASPEAAASGAANGGVPADGVAPNL